MPNTDGCSPGPSDCVQTLAFMAVSWDAWDAASLLTGRFSLQGYGEVFGEPERQER